MTELPAGQRRHAHASLEVAREMRLVSVATGKADLGELRMALGQQLRGTQRTLTPNHIDKTRTLIAQLALQTARAPARSEPNAVATNA